MARYVSYRDFDWLLLGFVLVICGMGVMEIHSATMHTKFAGAHVKQVYWVVAGVGAMFLVSLINYQALLDQIHWFYIAGVGSLMAVLLFGQKYLGARRWIKMPGGNHFQPSEWVKLILILAVAKYFAEMRQRELSWSDFMKAGAIVGIPMLMVLAQPDLGTALTYVPIAVMGVFLGGLQWNWIPKVRGTKLSNPRLPWAREGCGAGRARKHTAISSPFHKRTSFLPPSPRSMDS
jgi:rod shape determining protein RodA